VLSACHVRLVVTPQPCSYKQVRQRPEFAGRSIITMVQQHPSSSSSSSSGHSRELCQAAELDAFMLAEVMGVALQGYSRWVGGVHDVLCMWW
jgi:hypothetical protein